MFVLTVLMCVGAKAQKNDSLGHVKKSRQILELYNQKKFHELHQLGNASFRKDVSEAELTHLLREAFWSELGIMTNVTCLGFEKGTWIFKADFGENALAMYLALDDQEKILGLVFLPWGDGVAGEAEQTSRQNKPTDNPQISSLDSVVHATVKGFVHSPENCGISIGVTLNGKHHYYNYGETAKGNHQLPDKNSIYEIGSITKTFCGLLLAIAVNEKKISPEDDIRMYLPGSYPNLPVGKEAIRIKHLANHTSGLPRLPDDLDAAPVYDSLNPYKTYSREMVYASLKKLKPDGTPGTVCNYSNYGMALLGLILSDLYQKPFDVLVQEKICLPNGLKNTAVALNVNQQNRLMVGYNSMGTETPWWDLNGFEAAGGLHSDCENLLRYLDYNRAEKDPATRLAHSITFSGRQNVGMAWFNTLSKTGNHLIWHNGGTYGFSSFCGYIQEKDIAICVLTNSMGSVDHIAIAILNYLQEN